MVGIGSTLVTVSCRSRLTGVVFQTTIATVAGSPTVVGVSITSVDVWIGTTLLVVTIVFTAIEATTHCRSTCHVTTIGAGADVSPTCTTLTLLNLTVGTSVGVQLTGVTLAIGTTQGAHTFVGVVTIGLGAIGRTVVQAVVVTVVTLACLVSGTLTVSVSDSLNNFDDDLTQTRVTDGCSCVGSRLVGTTTTGPSAVGITTTTGVTTATTGTTPSSGTTATKATVVVATVTTSVITTDTAVYKRLRGL